MATRDPIKLIPELTAEDIKRFWSKVDVRGPDECWLWKAGATKKQGYGVFWLNGKSFYAHRIALHLHNGNIPSNMLSLHHCDVTGCCNAAAHLYVGTTSDNAIDRHTRGRAKDISGDNNPSRKYPERNAKLNRMQVIEIRHKGIDRNMYKELAKEYRVSKANIHAIVSRKTWKHIS